MTRVSKQPNAGQPEGAAPGVRRRCSKCRAIVPLEGEEVCSVCLLNAKPLPVKDSGSREAFDTGAKRDTREGKGRYDLITPEFEKELALVMEGGAAKYGDHNWEKGIPFCRSLDSCLRHLRQWQGGEEDENHLAHAAANLMFIITLRARGRRDLDDRVTKHKPEGA